MFKMLKVIDFVTLIIAVTALIISIVCMNKKCDNFGDTVCGVPGKLGEGESCISTPAGCGINGSEKMYCGEKLTCGYDGKCKSGESTEKCTGKDKSLCPGSGPTPSPSSNCDQPIKFVCNNDNCPDCKKKFPNCEVIKIPELGKSICGNPNVPIDPNDDHSFTHKCLSDGIKCNPDDKTDNNICKKFCIPLTENNSIYCSSDGYCRQTLFTDVNM